MPELAEEDRLIADAVQRKAAMPELAEEDRLIADAVQRKLDETGLSDNGVGVVRGSGHTVPGTVGADDPEYLDALERNLVQPIATEGTSSPLVGINRGHYGVPSTEKPMTPRLSRADEPAPPGSDPIVHDPMSADLRETARKAYQGYSDQRGEGVVLPDVSHNVGHVPAAGADGVLRSDVVLVPGVNGGEPPRQPAVILASSDSALQAEMLEKESARQVTMDKSARKLSGKQPTSTEDVELTDTGVVVSRETEDVELTDTGVVVSRETKDVKSSATSENKDAQSEPGSQKQAEPETPDAGEAKE